MCDGLLAPQPRDPIRAADEIVGEITSACLSPRLKRPIALGYVKRPHYEAVTPVTLGVPVQLIRATLAQLPFRA